MVTQQGMKRKEDITELINAILEQAVRTRQGFTPEVLHQFEREGSHAREERQRQQMRDATPVKQLGPVVARRREDVRADLSPDMKRQAIEAAVDLGERLELAAAGRRSRGEWVSG
jgi:hypothetical protein